MKHLILYLGLMWGLFFANLLVFSNYLMQFASRGGLCTEIPCVIGIFFHPFLHGSLGHLFGNTLMYLPLGLLIVYQDSKDFQKVFWLTTVIPGLATMVIQAPGTMSVGSSGVTFGFLGFLTSLCLFQRSFMNFGLLVWAVLVAGNTVWGMFPQFVPPQVSWQAHLIGFATGTLAAYLKTSKQVFWR